MLLWPIVVVVAGQISNQCLRSVVVVVRLVFWIANGRQFSMMWKPTNLLKYIFKVDTEKLKKECIEVVSNPFLLHYFRNTLTRVSLKSA